VEGRKIGNKRWTKRGKKDRKYERELLIIPHRGLQGFQKRGFVGTPLKTTRGCLSVNYTVMYGGIAIRLPWVLRASGPMRRPQRAPWPIRVEDFGNSRSPNKARSPYDLEGPNRISGP